MELFEQILLQALNNSSSRETTAELASLVEQRCYQTIRKIQEIVADESLEDPECFQRIEAFICELENLGLDGGSRHDF